MKIKPQTKRKALIGLITLLGVLIVFTFSYGAFSIGYEKGFQETKIIEIRGIADINPNEKITADFSVFWQAWDKLKTFHVKGAQLNDQDLVYGAIKGMIESLGDPDTVFFDRIDAKKFEEDVKGFFGGIGAELSLKNKQIIIVTPLKNTPAERIGLKPEDIILKVDEIDLSGMSVYDAVKIIRGEPGTVVRLLIDREDFKNPQEFEIKREIIRIPSVEWEMLDNQIAYLQVFSFNQETPSAFHQAASRLVLSGAKGIVLDLRSNPGGYLDVAVNLASWFLNRGEPVVVERFASGEENVLRARGHGFFSNMPVVILINRGSASASEILAGALRDNRGVKLVGEKSFGKGTVQQLETLKDDSTLKITIANWLTPKGEVIENNGLLPDYEVVLESDALINGQEDPQLQKAIEVLKQEMNKSE